MAEEIKMKTRTSFVSNSSSSSFIIGLKKGTNIYESLKEQMFPNDQDDKIITQYDQSFTVREIIEEVLKDITTLPKYNQRKYLKENQIHRFCRKLKDTSDKAIIELIQLGTFEAFPWMRNEDQKAQNKIMNDF